MYSSSSRRIFRQKTLTDHIPPLWKAKAGATLSPKKELLLLRAAAEAAG